jgi:hypothetical protein
MSKIHTLHPRGLDSCFASLRTFASLMFLVRSIWFTWTPLITHERSVTSIHMRPVDTSPVTGDLLLNLHPNDLDSCFAALRTFASLTVLVRSIWFTWTPLITHERSDTSIHMRPWFFICHWRPRIPHQSSFIPYIGTSSFLLSTCFHRSSVLQVYVSPRCPHDDTFFRSKYSDNEIHVWRSSSRETVGLLPATISMVT